MFGGFDDNTFFDPDKTATEYGALRAMLQNFASAARLKAYRDMIEEAEKKLKDTEKEKERLEKEQAALQANTAANLARIEELKKKNAENPLQAHTDSVSQPKNGRAPKRKPPAPAAPPRPALGPRPQKLAPLAAVFR